MRTIVSLVLQVTLLGASAAQVKLGAKSRDLLDAYSNAALGFRYTPPIGMRDDTSEFVAEIQNEARLPHAIKDHSALLAMSSGSDGNDPDWRSLSIETCPRSAISDQDEASAEAKMSAWLAHSEDANPSSNKTVLLSGQEFSVSLFAVQDGPIRKGASVWTTIRKGRFLSFFFAANSPAKLQTLAETMKTVQFFEPTKAGSSAPSPSANH